MTTTHTFNSQSDWTITDDEYIKAVGDTAVVRDLGDFTNSDLTDFCPVTMDGEKSIYICGRSFFTSGTFQPKAGDVPSDGAGFLNLAVTDVANSGWYQFLCTLPLTLWVGNNTSQNANGYILILILNSIHQGRHIA